MRITGGILRGRTLRVPARLVRPTQERVREALFSSLAPWIGDARVLDLFAGSGAFGLEAWSRGAAETVLVEDNPSVFRNLKSNIDALRKNGPDGCIDTVQQDALKFAGRGGQAAFDLIFADPPYETDAFRPLLETVKTNGLLAPEGLLIYEMRSSKHLRAAPLETLKELPDWELLKEKTYGEARILMLGLKEEEQ